MYKNCVCAWISDEARQHPWPAYKCMGSIGYSCYLYGELYNFKSLQIVIIYWVNLHIDCKQSVWLEVKISPVVQSVVLLLLNISYVAICAS